MGPLVGEAGPAVHVPVVGHQQGTLRDLCGSGRAAVGTAQCHRSSGPCLDAERRSRCGDALDARAHSDGVGEGGRTVSEIAFQSDAFGAPEVQRDRSARSLRVVCLTIFGVFYMNSV